MIKNETIFITGGAGYLGTKIVERYHKDNNIIVYSRDEAKHYYLKKRFPDVTCIIGDIRNKDLLVKSLRGATIGIFAASLKQIEAVDQNVEEGVETIVRGAINSRDGAIFHNLKSAAFISTDKSRAPTTLYGAMKLLAGEAFIVNAEKESVKLSSVIYGNVLNSTGSIIPLIWDSISNNYTLTLYGEEMTRFMIDIEDAIDCIEYGLKVTGYNVIPNLKSFKVKDLFEIYEEEFGLKYNLGAPRIGEKLHEQMISAQEYTRVFYDDINNMYRMHYKNINKEPIVSLSKNGLSSEDCTISKQELKNLLVSKNYYKPNN